MPLLILFISGVSIGLRINARRISFFLMKGEMLVNSQEYAGTMLREGEFILQAIGSKFEMLAMTECECIYYRFVQPELFCDLRFNHIMKEVSPPLIYSPLK